MTVVRGAVVTMNPDGEIIDDGASVISGDTIAAVGGCTEMRSLYPDDPVSGRAGDLILPRYFDTDLTEHLGGRSVGIHSRVVGSCMNGLVTFKPLRDWPSWKSSVSR